MDAIIAAYQELNPGMNSLLGCLIAFNLPFTLVKGLVDAALCFLIYKPLSPVLHGAWAGLPEGRMDFRQNSQIVRKKSLT